MKRPKYHFFVAAANGNGKSLLSLPGQTFGQIPVPANVLVKDMKGSTAVASARRKSSLGDIWFTTTLKRNGLSLVAKDMHSLRGCTDVFLADAAQEYENLVKTPAEP